MTPVVFDLISVEDALKDLYDKKAELVKKFVEENPSGLSAFQNEDGSWTRVSAADNKLTIDAGFYKTVRVKRYSVKIETLKNMPKELKV